MSQKARLYRCFTGGLQSETVTERGVEGEFDCNCFLHFPVCRCYAGGTHVASFHHSSQDYTNNQLKEEQLFLYIDTGTFDLVGHSCEFTLQCSYRNLTMKNLTVLVT